MNQRELAFSMPRTPRTAITPGQYYDLEVPEGHRVVITDVYIENVGKRHSVIEILEGRGPDQFECRYTFGTHDGETTIVNYTTGLWLGDEAPIDGPVRVMNSLDSGGAVLVRLNGLIVG